MLLRYCAKGAIFTKIGYISLQFGGDIPQQYNSGDFYVLFKELLSQTLDNAGSINVAHLIIAPYSTKFQYVKGNFVPNFVGLVKKALYNNTFGIPN